MALNKASKKKFLLFIFPGPVHGSFNRVRYEKISSQFTGAILAVSPNPRIREVKDIAGFQFHCVEYRYDRHTLSNMRFFLSSIRFGLHLRRKGRKVDLVITYDPLKTGILGLILSKMLGAKFAPEINGIYTSPDTYLDERKRIFASLKRYFFSHLERFVLKFADGIKILFKGQLAPFANTIKGKIVRCLPDYVDVDKFLNLDDIQEEKIVLFAGFPFRLKGVDTLIRAFKQIADRYPDWKLEILGWFPDPTQLDSEIDGHPRIYHHPPVLHSQMPLHVGASSIVVLPSRSEAMGRILVEAMAAGKPVIGSNTGGIPSVIRHGVEGFLFEKGNVAELSKKLTILIREPHLRARLGKNGRKRALAKYHPEIYCAQLSRFYLDILKEQ